MLLAVVLMFSALPFSVSADEVSSELPTESTVETQPKESQAEKEESSQTENSIIISDSSGDVPVLYAQDPFNTVKSEVEGGTNYMTSVGVTRQAIVRELETHEDDNYYLGTPYAGYYNYCIDTGYNPEGTPHRGSALFLHCSMGINTGGCIAIPEETMIQILKEYKEGKTYIAIGDVTDMQKLYRASEEA